MIVLVLSVSSLPSIKIIIPSFLHQQKVSSAVENTTTIRQESPVNVQTDNNNNNNNKTLEQRAKSYFIFPSQKAFFNLGLNATKQSDAAMLSGKETIQHTRAVASTALSFTRTKASPKMTSIKDYYIPSQDGNQILLRIFDPGVKQKPSPVLIFVHGGGWIVGTLDIFDDSIKRLANSSGLMVAAINYRLAPEHPFPAGLNDVVSAVRWISANGGANLGIDTKNMALGGDSAGANLALSAALALRNSNEGHILRALYLLYGIYSPTILNSQSMKMFGGGGFGLTYAQMRWPMNQTFKNASDYKNPLAFPLLDKNLTGLPPVYIAAMALDPLKDDSIQLANRFQQSGQEYYLAIWPGVSHGALSLIPVTPEIQKYLDAMTIYLKGFLTQS